MTRLIALAAASILALATSADAKTALWETSGAWTITGDTETGMCLSVTKYVTGHSIGIAFSNSGVDVAIGGVSADVGTNYSAIVKASTGEVGLMTAVGIGPDVVVFKNVNQTTVRALANARTIFIQGLGTFRLVGSKRAMASAWSCFEALNSF